MHNNVPKDADNPGQKYLDCWYVEAWTRTSGGSRALRELILRNQSVLNFFWIFAPISKERKDKLFNMPEWITVSWLPTPARRYSWFHLLRKSVQKYKSVSGAKGEIVQAHLFISACDHISVIRLQRDLYLKTQTCGWTDTISPLRRQDYWSSH